MLIQASDCLEMMTEAVLEGASAPEQSVEVLQDVLNWSIQLARHGIPDDVDFKPTSPQEIDSEAKPTEKIDTANNTESYTRVPVSLVNQLLRMTGETGILSDQVKERLATVVEDVKFSRDLSWQLHLQISDLDKLANIQSIASRHIDNAAFNKFDSLEMEQYNELHTCTSRLDEIATDIREMNIGIEKQLINLANLLMEQQNLQKENLNTVQKINMVSVDTIAARCQRIVRQTCRMTNKDVDLEFIGGDILINTDILNALADPLMHLLRNAIDHGIESEDERVKADKDIKGKITLRFEREGYYLSVVCQDDGRGLDYQKIEESAIKKGLVSAGTRLSHVDMNRLILTPGFSTRETITQVSGRGVGMDTVHAQLAEIKGSMRIDSSVGLGLTVELNVPLSLSSVLILLAQCGDQTIAISAKNVEQIIDSSDGSIDYSGASFRYDEQNYPLHWLKNLLNLSGPPGLNKKHSILLVKDETGETIAIGIDQILGTREVVVKTMGAYIPHIPGVTGATILGDGGVAPVIDLADILIDLSLHSYELGSLQSQWDEKNTRLPTALVVDDSLSARRSLMQLLKDSGFKVNTAIDGLDAIEKIDIELPDIMLVDLEMPRMNGVELTTHVRRRQDIAQVPVIMITSRSTDKHRKQAEEAGVSEYFIKPFSEDELLKCIESYLKYEEIEIIN